MIPFQQLPASYEAPFWLLLEHGLRSCGHGQSAQPAASRCQARPEPDLLELMTNIH